MEIKKISIIVPVYNGVSVISDCLSSINNCDIGIPYELIVVDDGSTDGTGDVVKSFSCEYIRIDKAGVAKARNTGIKKSTGDILLFFDADVKVKKDTVSKFLQHFSEDDDAYVIQGRWDKDSYAPSFSTQFLLLKYLYNYEGNLSDSKRWAGADLASGCLGIRKEVFDNVGGFDENYKWAGGEEHEFGLRLSKKYKVYYYRDIFVEHTYPNIYQISKRIYFRTVNFSMLVFAPENKDLLNAHKTSVPNHDKNGIILIMLILLSVLISFINFMLGTLLFWSLSFLYMFNIRGLLKYLVKEKGYVFAFKGAISHFLIMIPRLMGVVKAAILYYIFGKKDYKI
jgi:glycosyltransferase involved in cell wall biosynthesis